MHSFMLLGMFDWISDFFKAMFDFIPKLIYLIYASLACLLDVFQLVLRKLAGLDVYYDAAGNKVAGDIVTNFIAGILGIDFDGNTAHFDYSTLSTVFWSFVLFGVIIVFVSVFVAVIKSHYNYDDQSAKGPIQYVYTGLKALVNIAVVPLIVVLGLYVSQAVLTAVDSITSNPSAIVETLDKEKLVSVATSRNTAENSQNSGEMTCLFYDIFGFASGISYGRNSAPEGFSWNEKDLAYTAATNRSFSGSLFITAAYNGNRARTGQIKIVTGNENSTIFGLDSEVGLFRNAKSQDELANMIDTAFACNLHLKEEYARVEVQYADEGAGEWTSTSYFTNWLNCGMPAFSKFNVGAVWYYYDLWNFNFIVGFGAVIVCVTLFINIILGLITRIFLCLGLFLIAPPLFGLAPLDKGNAAKGWRENFMKQVLMAYGSILGMNIFFLLFPLINQINFFNIAVADYFMQTLIIIVGLISIKAFISVVSGLVGGEDANKSGDSIKEEVGQTMGKAVKMTAGAALAPGKVLKGAGHAILAGKNAVQAGWHGLRELDLRASAHYAQRANKETDKLIKKNFERIQAGDMSEQDFVNAGGSADLFNAIQNSSSIEEAKESYAQTNATYAANAERAQTFRNLADRRAQLKTAAERRMVRHGGKAVQGITSPLSLAKDSYLGDKGIKAFTETIWKPRDYARETADNTAAMRESMTSMDRGIGDLNSGMGTLNQNVTSGFENQANETRNMGTRVTGAVISTREKLGSKIDEGTSATQEVGNKVDESSRIAQEMAIDKEKLAKKQRQLQENKRKIAQLKKQINENVAEREAHRGHIATEHMLDDAIRKDQETIKELETRLERNKDWTKK